MSPLLRPAAEFNWPAPVRPRLAAQRFQWRRPQRFLWRNDDGTLTDWLRLANGGFSSNSGNFTKISRPIRAWQIVGTGDFNGDGKTDILWRNTNGTVTDWLGTANGSFTDNSSSASTGAAGANWHIVGTGDFNGDGKADILWRDDNGFVTDWLGSPSGAFVDNGAAAGTGAAPNSWHVAGTGDFNGDGKADILWRDDTGFVTEWLGTATGGFVDDGVTAGTGAAPNNWLVVATGDFNGDGYTDILWRNDVGYLSDWLGSPSGAFTDNVRNAGTTAAPSNWTVAGTGDFNGDGRADILWRNDVGFVSEWLGTLNGSFVDNVGRAGTAAPTSWHVQNSLF